MKTNQFRAMMLVLLMAVVSLGHKSCIFRERVVLLSHMGLKYNKKQLINRVIR